MTVSRKPPPFDQGWELMMTKGAKSPDPEAVSLFAAIAGGGATVDALVESLFQPSVLASLTKGHARTALGLLSGLVAADDQVAKASGKPAGMDRVREAHALLTQHLEAQDKGGDDDDEEETTVKHTIPGGLTEGDLRKLSAVAPLAETPLEQLDRLAKAKAGADGVSYEKGYASVLASPEGAELYAKAGEDPEATVEFVKTSQPAARRADTPELDRLDRMAKARATDGGTTVEKAYAEILATPEGAELYEAYERRRTAS